MAKKKVPIQWKTLQPGFLIGTFSRQTDMEDLYLPTPVWKEMKANGFYGGFFIPEGVTLESLSDAELAKRGLRRVQ